VGEGSGEEEVDETAILTGLLLDFFLEGEVDRFFVSLGGESAFFFIYYCIIKMFEFITFLFFKIIYFFKRYELKNDFVNLLYKGEIINVIEASPPNIQEIKITYGKNIFSTENKKIKKIKGVWVPLKFSFISFLYEKHRDHDIEIEITVDKNMVCSCHRRIIEKEDKTKLQGWTKELDKTIKN